MADKTIESEQDAVREDADDVAAAAVAGSRRADEIDKLVGCRLMSLRKSKGITQAELGRALGVSFQQIQRYENGTNRIGPSRLRRAADALGVDLGYFFADSPLLQIYESSTVSRSAEDSLRLLELFTRIADPDVRSSILKIVEELATAGRPKSSCTSPEPRSRWIEPFPGIKIDGA